MLAGPRKHEGNNYLGTHAFSVVTLLIFSIREAFNKKNHFLIDIHQLLIIDEKPLRFGGPVRGVTPPPFIKVKNNIV